MTESSTNETRASIECMYKAPDGVDGITQSVSTLPSSLRPPTDWGERCMKEDFLGSWKLHESKWIYKRNPFINKKKLQISIHRQRRIHGNMWN